MTGANRKNRPPLAERVASAAAAALAEQGYVSPIDVFLGIGWVDGGTVGRWRQGRIDCLEEALQARPERIAAALRLLHSWAAEKGLSANPTPYLARTPQRQNLHFSRSGDPAVEAEYRTHWLSPALPEKKRERVVAKAARAPELVVISPRNRDWRCHRCGGSGDLLLMENAGPACLACVGLADLEFLAAGDPLLTRRAKANSRRCAVVVRFSRTRGRYERQGLLVEPQALAAAQRSIEEPRRS